METKKTLQDLIAYSEYVLSDGHLVLQQKDIDDMQKLLSEMRSFCEEISEEEIVCEVLTGTKIKDFAGRMKVITESMRNIKPRLCYIMLGILEVTPQLKALFDASAMETQFDVRELLKQAGWYMVLESIEESGKGQSFIVSKKDILDFMEEKKC
jgi:wyosine [tRNA(Phe)-imidazoG37] synthetase (radical SAM superfamily)